MSPSPGSANAHKPRFFLRTDVKEYVYKRDVILNNRHVIPTEI